MCVNCVSTTVSSLVGQKDLQHLASSRPSAQSFLPSQTLFRGTQRPSPQRNCRGQAATPYKRHGCTFKVSLSATRASGFTYCPLERRRGRAGGNPCESEIHPSGSGGRAGRSRSSSCCRPTPGCTTFEKLPKQGFLFVFLEI